MLGVAVEPVERQPVEADQGDVGQHLGVGVEAQAETVDVVVLGGLQLGDGGAVGDEAGEHLAGNGERFVGLAAARLQADLEQTRHALRREVAVHRIGEAALLAHFLHQA